MWIIAAFALLCIPILIIARARGLLTRRFASLVFGIAIGIGTGVYFDAIHACPRPALLLSIWAGLFAPLALLLGLTLMQSRLKPDDPRRLPW